MPWLSESPCEIWLWNFHNTFEASAQYNRLVVDSMIINGSGHPGQSCEACLAQSIKSKSVLMQVRGGGVFR